MSRVYCIDFGTSAIKIYQKGIGIVYNEKNVLALFEKRKMIAIGDEAFGMIGKTPSEIEIVYPVRFGVLAEIKNTLSMLNTIFDKISEEHDKIPGQEVLIAVPCYATEVQRKAMVDIIADSEARPKRIRIVDMPIAAAIGAGVDLKESLSAMVVDIGADITDISVVSRGGVIENNSLKIGGNLLDESIISAIRMEYKFIIGKKTAEQVRIKLGTCIEPSDEESVEMKVLGRDLVSGLPGSITVDSYLIYSAMKEAFETIAENVNHILKSLSAEVSYDISDSGIFITGGVSQTPGLDKLINGITHLDIKKGGDGSCAVALGLGKISEDPELDYLAEKYSAFTIIE